MPTTPLSARRAFDGDRSFKVATGERIDGTLAKDLEELMEGEGNALLHAGTSENLCFLPDRSVDAVITAPPILTTWPTLNWRIFSTSGCTWAWEIVIPGSSRRIPGGRRNWCRMTG